MDPDIIKNENRQIQAFIVILDVLFDKMQKIYTDKSTSVFNEISKIVDGLFDDFLHHLAVNSSYVY